MEIMGILNITPDSFSDGGKFSSIDAAVSQAKKMIADGAKIIDIGGESTRPDATFVTENEELSRVIPIIRAIRAFSDIPISIDTYKANVARLAVDAGATMINDVWAGRKDPLMYETMANVGVSVILMHNRKNEEENTICVNIIDEVISELQRDIDAAISAGVKKENIIIDPGIGFGKTLEQNIQLIKNIDKFKKLGYPVLLAASKKRTIKALAMSEEIEGIALATTAVTAFAFMNYIDFIRVHDVAENKLVIDVLTKLRQEV